MARYGDAENIREKLLAAENGTLHNSGHDSLSVALVSLSPYSVAMASLGFQTVYRLFNSHPESRCERVFCFDPQQATRESSWMSLESGARPSEFDVVAVSLSYEQDCLMLPALLAAMGLPLRAEKRWGNLPIVLCGGPVATANPEPVAPFVDAVGLGDGEGLVPDFIDCWCEAHGRGWERERFLQDLAARPGFYVPSLYGVETVEGESGRPAPRALCPESPAGVERWVDSLAGEPAHSVIITGEAHFAGMFMLELARGCCYACRFCLVSRINRPYRPTDPRKLIEYLDRVPEAARTVGLVGANLCDHPELESILMRVRDRGLRLGVSSLRVDTLTPEIMGLMRDCGVRTVTLAPETASQNLLGQLGKPSAAERLPIAVQGAAEMGFSQIKLYYMYGLPGETSEDRAALVEQVRALAALAGARLRLKVSLNPFVPKPQTMWQDEPMLRPEALRAALAEIRRGLAAGPRVELQTDSLAECLAQGLVSQGDRRMAGALEKSALEGMRFIDAVKATVPGAENMLHQKKEPSAPRPWRLLE